MAKIKYFNGTTQLTDPHGLRNEQFALQFPGVKGLRYDSFTMFVGYVPGTKTLLPVERKIEYKSAPSMHACDSRCMHARGRICECSCGGKNHGGGSFFTADLFSCEAA